MPIAPSGRLLAVVVVGAAGAGGDSEGMLAPVLVGGGRVLAAADGGVAVAAGTCWLDVVREPRLSDPSIFPLTSPAGAPNSGFLLALGAGGGGPFDEIPVRANWSLSAVDTATLAAAPAALPAAVVALSVSPATPRCGGADADAAPAVGNRWGRDAKYSSRSPKKACFSWAGRLAIILRARRRLELEHQVM